MALIAKVSDGKPRDLIPPGAYFALVNRIYDLGTQSGGNFGPKHQILVSWELHKRSGPARDQNGNVLTISNFYSLSFNDKSNLRAAVQSMLGRSLDQDFNMADLLGKPCRIQIGHEAKTNGMGMREKIVSLMPLDEEDRPPQPETDQYLYEIDVSQPIPEYIPEWIRKLIRGAAEFTPQISVSSPTRSAAPSNGGGPRHTTEDVSFDDGIPF